MHKMVLKINSLILLFEPKLEKKEFFKMVRWSKNHWKQSAERKIDQMLKLCMCVVLQFIDINCFLCSRINRRFLSHYEFMICRHYNIYLSLSLTLMSKERDKFNVIIMLAYHKLTIDLSILWTTNKSNNIALAHIFIDLSSELQNKNTS